MFPDNRICKLFNIEYPIIQAGMVWCSGWELASAVSNAGGLGILGAGSMYPDVLEENIVRCQSATDKPFGVNIPLLYADIEKHTELLIKYKVPIVFTSAGNPATLTPLLKSHGMKVVHVIASTKFALKAQAAGCDAIVAEGFEAGGHNGREETTSFCLIPQIRKAVDIPLIAAGGIATGEQLLAAMVLGADAAQLGTRFVACKESSAHDNFKNKVIELQEGDTLLSMKKLVPVRLIKNDFFAMIQAAEDRGASKEELAQLLGRARAKKGMYEGDMKEGELEIGQIAAIIDDILPASEIIHNLLHEYSVALKKVIGLHSL